MATLEGLKDRRDRLREWLEVALVITLTLLPAALVKVQPLQWPKSCLIACGMLAMQSLQVSALVLYLVWIRTTPWSGVGIVKPHAIHDTVRGIGLYLSDAVLCGLVVLLYVSYGRASPNDSVFKEFPFPAHPLEWFLLVCASIAAAFAEELLVRGYILSRLEKLLNSSVSAILLSAIMFGIAHGYKQPIGIVATILSGALFGVCFVWWRRLWPLVIAHAALNISVFVLVVARLSSRAPG